MKTFIMLDMPDNVKDHLVNLQSHLDIDKVSRDKLHLTMRFIGEITCEQDEKIQEEFSKLILPQMIFLIDRMGIFYNQTTVVWAGLSGDLNSLFSLNRTIENLVNRIVGSAELPFKPHITLGRTVNYIDLSMVQIPPISFSPVAMAYVHSEKVNGETVYRIIKKVVCGG